MDDLLKKLLNVGDEEIRERVRDLQGGPSSRESSVVTYPESMPGVRPEDSDVDRDSASQPVGGRCESSIHTEEQADRAARVPRWYPSSRYQEREEELELKLDKMSPEEIEAGLRNPTLPDQLWRHFALRSNS